MRYVIENAPAIRTDRGRVRLLQAAEVIESKGMCGRPLGAKWVYAGATGSNK
jgi:hypothetical protein